MADITVDGLTRVYFVTTIASIAAPTVAELNAGVRVGAQLLADGLEGFEPSTAKVDNTSIESTFGTSTPGRTEFGDTALVLKKQSGTDTTFTTLNTKGTTGYIVIRDGIDADTAWTAAQIAAVYPVTTGQWAYLPREANAVLKYRVPIPVSAEPNQIATVAA